MGIFRPSAQVRLQLRLEEYNDTGTLTRRLDRTLSPTDQALPGAGSSASATSNAEQLAAVQQSLQQLIARRESIAEPEYRAQRARLERERERLQRSASQEGRGTADQQPPEAVTGTPPDDRVIIGQILPRSVTIERNGLRTADTANVTLDYADAPIDPRIIRAASIEIVLGVVSPSDFERGMRGALRDDGSLFSVVPRGTGFGPLAEATRFVGWVDEWEIEHDSEEGDTLSLKCRDMTAILLDTPLPTGFAINLDEPIVRGIQALLDSIPATQGIRVRYGWTDDEDTGTGPTPAEATGRPATHRTRRGRGARRARSGDQRMNVWDHITDTVVSLGLVPLMQGYELRLVLPRTYFGRASQTRRMVYGRNLQGLSFTRKLGGVQVPTVQVRSYDPTLGRTRWAQHPVAQGTTGAGVFPDDQPPRTRANAPGVSGQNPDDRIQVFTVSGVTNAAQLQQIAESTWQQIGRQEIEGHFATEDLSSVESETSDLLALNSGDAVELLMVAPSGAQSLDGPATLQRLQAMNRQTRAHYLIGIGWRREVAERLARLQDATGFQTVFRAQNVRISWDGETGARIECDFVNFIEVRELGATQQQTTGATPSAQATARARGRTSSDARRLLEISRERREIMEQVESGELPVEASQQRLKDLEREEGETVQRLRES